MKKYAEKTKDYLSEVRAKVRKSEEFLEYVEKFGDSKDAVEKYLLKLALELKKPVKPRKNKKEDKEEHLEILENTGEFLEKTGKLDEIKKEYNRSVLSITEDFAGKAHVNPFVVSKEQLKMEFSKEKNSKLDDIELDVKSCYWENKLLKTIEGLRNAYADDVLSKKDIPSDEFRKRIIEPFTDSLFAKKSKFLPLYEKYIKGEVTRETLEKSPEFKVARNIAKDVCKAGYMDKNALDLDFIAQSKLFSSVIDERYRYKDIYVQRTILEAKEKKDMRLGIYKEFYAENNQNFIPCGFTLNKYNSEALLHVEKKAYNRFQKDVEVDYEGVYFEEQLTENTVFFKYTEKQLDKIEQLNKKKFKLNPLQRKYLNFLTRVGNVNLKDTYMKKFIMKKDKIKVVSSELKKEVNKEEKEDFERGGR